MRTMPTVLEDGVRVPAVAPAEWWDRLGAIAGRRLTDDERVRADQMGRHNWTLRVVADALFGEDVVAAHFDP